MSFVALSLSTASTKSNHLFLKYDHVPVPRCSIFSRLTFKTDSLNRIEGFAGTAVVGYFEYHVYLIWLTAVMAILMLPVVAPQAVAGASASNISASASLADRLFAARGDWEGSILFYG